MITLTPAYNRDYKNKQAVIADWQSNKDFIFNDITSPYDQKPINLQDVKNLLAPVTIKIRYQKLTKLIVIDVIK